MQTVGVGPPRLAVIGATGQLGSDIVTAARDAGHEVSAFGHEELEIMRVENIRDVLERSKPDLVVNSAAMNHVEGCEQNPAEAFAVNATGVRNLALVTASLGVPVMHISTDYVFRGNKSEPYLETDLPGPVNVYGASKLAGEHFVAALNPRHFIVRTSALYGVNRCRAKPQDNFVKALLRKGRESGKVQVVADQRVSPTSTASLSRQLLRIAATGEFGLFHATSQGDCTWAEFASEIFSLSGIPSRVVPILAAERSNLLRPEYSVLRNARLQGLGIDIMPGWRAALAEYLRTLGAAA